MERNTCSTTGVWQKRKSNNNPEGKKCGFECFYPICWQKFATPRSFLVCFCIANILQGMVFTYIIGIQTSIEKHFHFDVKTLGLLLSLGEIGPILTTIWISHVGTNRPRWMGVGLLLMALSLFMCFTMNYTFPPPLLVADRLSTLESNGPEKNICKRDSIGNNSTSSLHHDDLHCTIDPVRRQWAFGPWVLIYCLLAIGVATINVMMTPYFDDCVPNNEFPFYYSITLAVRIVGPVLGYLLCSGCLKLYVDINKNPGWESDDSRWIGAWWLGALILATLISLFAVVLASFPRVMKYVENETDGKKITTNGTEISTAPSTITLDKVSNFKGESKEDLDRGFKPTILRVLRNKVVLYSCASSVFTVLGVNGYYFWQPKYFEHEFRLSKADASMYSGLAANVTKIFGVLISGYLMMKYKPSSGKVELFIAISKYVYAFGLLLVMLISDCGFMADLPGEMQPDGSLMLSQGCNDDCNCSTAEFQPTCLRSASKSEQTYFSPCYAGCTEFSSLNKTVNYNSCGCVEDLSSSMTSGFCRGTCNNLYIYLLISAIVEFIVAFGLVGTMIIDLRCVDEIDKVIALGFQLAIIALFANLPSPNIYGSLIDSSCLVWELSCGEIGSCWVYNTVEFRYKLHGLASVFLMLAGVFKILIYYEIRGSLLLYDDVS